jgi:LysM repeat protein
MKRLTVILALMLAFPALCLAQDDSYEPVPVEISSVRAERDNVWYYVHKVQPRQTLYSICRAYDVTQQEVYEANRAALETGLKAGMELYIPYHGDIKARVEAAMEKAAEARTQTQTTSQAQAQPQVQTPPQEQSGQQSAPEYTTHRVKWYESLYSIARKYDVTPESILKANHLTRVDLNTGQILRIPTTSYQDAVERQVNNDYVEEVIEEPVVPDFEESPLFVEDEETDLPYDDDIFFSQPFSGKAKIALLLPFNSRSSSPSSNYLDFYSGVLLALERIKSQGVDADLKVIDLSDYANNISALASDQFLGDRDFVIGPVMSADLARIVDYCNSHRIPLISPMDQQAERLAADNPYFIQAPVSAENQVARLVESMNYSSPSQDNVIVIRETGSDTSYFKQVEAALLRAGIPYKTFSYGILEGRRIDATLSSSYLSGNKTNHIIIASEKESFASDAVRNISLLSTRYDIVGYGSNRLRNFETIELEAYQNVSMHFSLGYFVDYKRPEVRDFVFKYRALFNTEPGAYAFQGYDLTSYFTEALRKYGKRFNRRLDDFDMKLLQSNMHYEKASPRGGYVNKATKNIVYLDDYSIACE